MKIVYSSLSVIIAVVMFAAVALADPGTTWQNKIDTPGRFTLLSAFDNDAVFDRETGRVWEQSPNNGDFDWFDALLICYQKEVGGRKGWRLPTIEELMSLVDTSQRSPALPPRNPFNNVQGEYWSATTAVGSDSAFILLSGPGGLATAQKTGSSATVGVWCVRGGQGIDGLQ